MMEDKILNIIEINQEWEKEILEISYGPLIFVYHKNNWNIISITKNNKDWSFWIPKWKVDIKNWFIESSNETIKREFKEETWIDLNDEKIEILLRLEPVLYKERKKYYYKPEDTEVKKWEKKVWDKKEISIKTIEWSPIIINTNEKFLNQLEEWIVFKDKDEREKERIITLLNISEINSKLKEEQQEPIKSAINELKEKLKNKNLKKYILEE